MNWLNIYTPTLRSPKFIGSDPVARGTWLYVLAYCCEQENGGTIRGARAWKDRQWQQTCGVTLAEIEASSPLMTWDGDDLSVESYPAEKEMLIRARREYGRIGGQAKSEAKKAAAIANGQSRSQAKAKQRPSMNPREGEGEGEDKGEDKEKEEPPKGGGGGDFQLNGAETQKPNSELEIRVGSFVHRRQTTRWSTDERKRLKKLTPIPEDELDALERYYRADIPDGDDIRRQSLDTLLNNWHGEIDRARNFFRKREKREAAL